MAQSNPDYPYGKGTGEGANERLRDMADTASDKLKDAGEGAREMAEQAREYGDKAQQAAGQIKPFVERSLREQPMTTLVGVAVIGFVLGALWKK